MYYTDNNFTTLNKSNKEIAKHILVIIKRTPPLLLFSVKLKKKVNVILKYF